MIIAAATITETSGSAVEGDVALYTGTDQQLLVGQVDGEIHVDAPREVPGEGHVQGDLAAHRLRVEGREAEAQRLQLGTLPRGWQAATAMRAIKVDAAGRGVYEAADYDELADHPFELGSFWRGHFDAAGVPHEGVELKIVAPDTGAALPAGEPGEIWTRSRHNMVGYWRDPVATAATITADGWLRTGDVGYFDADGYLYIHDRVKDMIISGGENIYPAEVENVLAKHPSVGDVAVIGIPSEVWGESPFAVVVPARGAEVDVGALLAFARQHLAKYKVPVGVDLRATLPRTPTGKLLKRELRAPYWQGRSRGVG